MKYLFLLFLSILAFNLFGQETRDTTKAKEIILIAENEPSFPGRRTELYKFINGKLKYPREARKSGIQGTVVISFVVERDDIKIEQSVHPSLDAEAMRVVKLMPAWTPANHSGRNVRARTGFPIKLSLD